MNHAGVLGWTGERLAVCGDSAGGNLLTAITLHLIEMGVDKLPDGLVSPFIQLLFLPQYPRLD